MESLPPINLVSIIHLVCLGLWGGVVAAELVLELYPFRRTELHEHSIRYHYWIDLLVELPIVFCVCLTGAILVVLAWPLSGTHVIKIICALVAVSANLVCIIVVLRRKKRLEQGAGDDELLRSTRRIIYTAAVGLPCAYVAAGIGFYLAYHRMLDFFG